MRHQRNRFLRQVLTAISGSVLLVACLTQQPVEPTSSATYAPPTQLPTTVAYPLKVSANHRYLVDQNDQPFFLDGDAAWSLISQGTRSDVELYLDNRQSKGVNTILVNLLEHEFANNAPNNIFDDPPFTGTDFVTPNEAYFAYADWVIAAAGERGIQVLLAPLYLGYGCGAEGWCAEVQAASTTDLETWAAYVGHRYGQYDNLIWVIGGDTDPGAGGVSAKVEAFVARLLAADPRHLVTAHTDPEAMAVDRWPTAAWLNLNTTYTGYTGHTTYTTAAPNAQKAFAYTPTLPFFNIESYYENVERMTDQQLRAQAYWTVLGGGVGFVFGNSPLWELGFGGRDWKTSLDQPGSLSMAHLRTLFQTFAWQNLVPDSEHTTLTRGYGTLGQADYVSAARLPDGSFMLAYLPVAQTVTVDLTRLSASARAAWYDPATGSYTSIQSSPFPNTGSVQFTSPDENGDGGSDWVLVLDARLSGQP